MRPDPKLIPTQSLLRPRILNPLSKATQERRPPTRHQARDPNIRLPRLFWPRAGIGPSEACELERMGRPD